MANIDWVTLGKTMTKMTVDTTMRFQAAGVQLGTYEAMKQVTQCFTLSTPGQQNLELEIKKLRWYWNVSNTLYFGFGARSLFTYLNDNRGGLNIIALCSTLSEMHSDSISARILAALLMVYHCPDGYQPSHTQLLGLIKACSGSISASPFPEIVSRMLDPASIKPWMDDDTSSDPTDLAKALSGLFDVTQKRKSSIFVTGGQSCAYIAAIAHWLFSLRTFVEDRNGKTIFASSVGITSVNATSCQVHVRYDTSTTSNKIAIMRSTYVVREFRDLFIAEEPGTTTLRRRLSWENCLSLAYGSEFDKFMELQTCVGSMLGSMARVYLAHHKEDIDLDVLDRKFFINYSENSYGRDFVNAVGALFPELSSVGVRRAMEKALVTKLSVAKMELECCLSYFKSKCECLRCAGSIRTLDYGCYLGFAATLVDLIVTLFSVNIEHDEKIRPTLAGLRRFLKLNTQKMCYRDLDMSERVQILLYKRRTGEKYVDYDTTRRLETAIEDIHHLFTGMNHTFPQSTDPKVKRRTRVAVSSNGICVFIEGIRELSTRAETMRCIHVIPGRIAKYSHHENSIPREYDTISDPRIWPKSTLETLTLSPLTERHSQSDVELPEISATEYPEAAISTARESRSQSDLEVPETKATESPEASTPTVPVSVVAVVQPSVVERTLNLDNQMIPYARLGNRRDLQPAQASNFADEGVTDPYYPDHRIVAEVMEGRDPGDLTFFYRIIDSRGDLLIPTGLFTMGILHNVGLVHCDHRTCKDGLMQYMPKFQVEQGWKLDLPEATSGNLPEETEECLVWSPISNSEFGRKVAFATACQAMSNPTPRFQQWPILRRDECLSCCIEYAADLAEKEKNDSKLPPTRRIFHII
ncbi:hypothetical protein J4E89_002446 [Alternaria sp. Ai002NY15]|nr:hypothetical protein J4E89_002446 [Alternaria sp. Ai002NY15]